MNEYFSALKTELPNEATANIDKCSTLEMATLMNAEDIQVPLAVQEQLPMIAKAIDIIYDAFKKGGRLIYLGAGTSGRLGVLDASECPPTFSTNPEMVQAFIAGGDTALRNAVEACEDNEEQGQELIISANVCEKDVVVGITASGSAPFVLAAIKKANAIGAKTVGVTTNANTKLSEICTVCIAPIVGAEVIAGSTRLKSGTAQKLVLNMLTTCAMIKLGKVYGNLMVDLRPSNEKLFDRAKRIIERVTSVSECEAQKALDDANGSTKLAIMIVKSGLSPEMAKQKLDACDGILKNALQE